MHIQNLTLYRGDTHIFEIELTDESGSPVELVGTSVAALVQPKGGGMAVSPDVAVVGSVIVLTFAPHHTQGSTWRSAEYDVQLTQGDVVTTILRGRIELIRDVTP